MPRHLLEPRHNLPTQLSSFVGRKDAIGEVRRLLATSRLLTLSGPGGIGKTRLALAVAEAALADYSGGVWFVDLAPLSDSALVPATVAEVLRIVESGRPLTEQLAEACVGRSIGRAVEPPIKSGSCPQTAPVTEKDSIYG